MYRWMVRVLGASRVEVVLWLLVINHLHLPTASSLSRHQDYRLVTAARADPSTPRSDVTEHDAEVMTSESNFMTPSYPAPTSQGDHSELSRLDTTSQTAFHNPDMSRARGALRHQDTSRTVKMLPDPPDALQIVHPSRTSDTPESVETLRHPTTLRTADTLRHIHNTPSSKSVIFSSDQKHDLKVNDRGYDFKLDRSGASPANLLAVSPHSKHIPQLHFHWWNKLFTNVAQSNGPIPGGTSSDEGPSVGTGLQAGISGSNDSGAVQSEFSDTLKDQSESRVNFHRDQLQSGETPDDQSKPSYTLKHRFASGSRSKDQSKLSDEPRDQSEVSDFPDDQSKPTDRFEDHSGVSDTPKDPPPSNDYPINQSESIYSSDDHSPLRDTARDQSESSHTQKHQSNPNDTPGDRFEASQSAVLQTAGNLASAEVAFSASSGGDENRDTPHLQRPDDFRPYDDLQSDAEDVGGRMAPFTSFLSEDGELAVSADARTGQSGVKSPPVFAAFPVTLGKTAPLPLKRTYFLTDRFAEGTEYASSDDVVGTSDDVVSSDDFVAHGIRPKRDAVSESDVTTEGLRSSENSHSKLGSVKASGGMSSKAPRFQKNVADDGTSSDSDSDSDSHVVTEVPASGRAPSVDAVFDTFPARDVDNTDRYSITTAATFTADDERKEHIKRELSFLTTADPNSPDVPTGSSGSGRSTQGNDLDLDLDPDLDPDLDLDPGPEAVKIGVILPFAGPFPWVLQKTYPALQLAVERVKRLGVLPNRTLQLVLRDSFCSETYGPLQGIDLYVEKAAHVFVGPACDYAVAPLARFSFRWQIPILTAGALVSAFQDRREYRLLTRVQGAYSKASEFVLSVFENFGWRWSGLLYHDTKDSPNQGRSNCYFTVEAVFLTLRNSYGREPWHRQFNAKQTPPEGYAQYLREASRDVRVVVLCASPDSVREIMIKAHDLNFDNGEYVFFNIDLFSSKDASQRPWYRKSDTEERNAKARKAYEALMTVTLRKPTSPEYRAFSNDVKERARNMYPNFTYGEEEVNSFVGAFHDAVLLYALALNETLANNGSISDGAAITRRMWNRTFEGITGNVSIDDNGDRNADYSLLDLNPATGQFEVVANYYGNKKRYEPVEGKSIHWAGGRTDAPPDTPRCGFDGSKCPPEEPFPEYGIVIIVLGSILLIVIVAVFVIYRHIKLEAELAEMNWRVRWEDILFGSPEKNKKLERQGSKLSLVRRGSCPSSVSGDTLAFQLSDAGHRQLFTKTGYYKGAIIAIKSIPRTNITISKPLLLEIKRMKDLQNDHIVRFLGACIDYPNQSLLTEYCPKGSLQDVLENEQIKLDWMFRYSIMQDIVRGMAYLHGTDLRSHGNLKSTNCVVDSRFVVKITDFGLHYFRHNPEFTEEENAYRSYHSKLWTAPELLRMQCRPPEGTAKGDVFSFAIICQEIVYRNGVFFLTNLDLTPQEIHGKVRNGLKPYFRPTLEEYDCPCDELAHVIRRCWAEDPSDRPDFTQLKTIIRKLNRDGDKGNILDNLLSRMEQYANNLEALVEERTADYLQQKKKAEDLLYNMLPRSVALQLIRGESVTAESFDSVSIYFSDICGFTAMSAESTPMQVVDLLNDLYTTFDSIIENFDVYKVETIGDAYMVVSGLPEKNGDLHAREIARMSLMLLEAVLSFRIRHRPQEQLKLRIGIHSGPVCTGVVGHKMPRYCLFGDTVNTASRMESNGLPLRIHVSNTTKQVLDRFGVFELESRGEVAMKGKGSMLTWWLLGERPIQESPGGGATLNIL